MADQLARQGWRGPAENVSFTRMATAGHIVRKMVPPPRRTLVSHAGAGGWQRIVARWKAAIDYVVPVGYEDETGFHYGEAPAHAEVEFSFDHADFTA